MYVSTVCMYMCMSRERIASHSPNHIKKCPNRHQETQKIQLNQPTNLVIGKGRLPAYLSSLLPYGTLKGSPESANKEMGVSLSPWVVWVQGKKKLGDKTEVVTGVRRCWWLLLWSSWWLKCNSNNNILILTLIK